MRAAFYQENGPAKSVLKIGDIETPAPGIGEVRVRIASSGINPSDVKSRMRKPAYPRVIPHSDGAGTIDQVGEGVAKSRIGERVWIWNGQWKRPYGTAAEFIVVPAVQAVPLPDKISFEAGACLGIPAMTAFHAVELAVAGQGASLLITGGAGSVSQYAIEFAKARGASVITTVSSDEKARIARESGADFVIDYRRENVGERTMELTGNRGIDAIIEMDLAVNVKSISSIIRPKGTVIIYGTSAAEATIPAHFLLMNSINLKFFLVYELDSQDRERATSGVNRALRSGILSNRVAEPFALDQIAAAHAAVENGTTIGNVTLAL
jgi:NADPH2:quinone reductase